MADYGRAVLGSTGQPVRVSYDGEPEWKAGGITLDWSTVPTAAADTTLADGTVIKAGYKGLVFGTVLQKETSSGLYGLHATTMVATTLSADVAIGATTIAVTSATNMNPGDKLTLGTGGTSEIVSIASVSGTTITLQAAATKTHVSTDAVSKPDDGRQALTAGETYILDQTVLQNQPGVLFSGPSDHPPVFEGGMVWKDRLQVGGTGQPTLAALLAVLPRLRLVEG